MTERTEAPDRLLSTAEVAGLAGVTSRTLRHYDAVGLVPPAATGPGGLRYYGPAELQRLQRVLLLRRLGLGLDAVAAALDGVDELQLLRDHLVRLRTEQHELGRLVTTVESTVAALEGAPMTPEEIFGGFDPVRQARYEAEVVDRHGDGGREHVAQSQRAVSTMTKAEADQVQADFEQHERDVADLIVDGAAPDDPRVQAVVAEHFRTISRFWAPDAESYAGLGDLYVDSPDFRSRYDAVHPGLAEFLRDAMGVYAVERLPSG